MDRIRRLLTLGVATALLVASLSPSVVAVQPVVPDDMGEMAYSYTEQLSVEARIAGTTTEAEAAAKVLNWFAEVGYGTEYQEFSYGPASKRSYSQNVVAFKPAVHASGAADTGLVIVGAHYDCVAAGEGADDNASGVGAMLEVAARLAEVELPYDLVFVAFGAEEVGLKGSNYYVSQMSKRDRRRAVAMINFDSLIAGDYRYIHAGFNHQTWARDEMLEIVEDFDLDIREHEAPRYPAGITPPGFSDYTAFSKAGIPVVAFESTNWEIGKLDGYLQLDASQFEDPDYADLWEIWHTEHDVLDFIDALLGDRPEQHLEAYTTLVYVFLSDLNS